MNCESSKNFSFNSRATTLGHFWPRGAFFGSISLSFYQITLDFFLADSFYKIHILRTNNALLSYQIMEKNVSLHKTLTRHNSIMPIKNILFYWANLFLMMLSIIKVYLTMIISGYVNEIIAQSSGTILNTPLLYLWLYKLRQAGKRTFRLSILLTGILLIKLN